MKIFCTVGNSYDFVHTWYEIIQNSANTNKESVEFFAITFLSFVVALTIGLKLDVDKNIFSFVHYCFKNSWDFFHIRLVLQ